MDADSEYYNIYSKEPAAKVTIYTSILYFVIVIYESMVDVFFNNKIIDFLSKTAYNLSRNILLLSTANKTFVTLNLHIYISKIIFEPFGSSISLYD